MFITNFRKLESASDKNTYKMPFIKTNFFSVAVFLKVTRFSRKFGEFGQFWSVRNSWDSGDVCFLYKIMWLRKSLNNPKRSNFSN